MDWIIVAGVVSFGAIVGWMGCMLYFGSRDIRTFRAIIGVFCGTVIVSLFQSLAGRGLALPREVWLYPVGLLIGIAISSMIYGHQLKQEQAIKNRKLEEENKKIYIAEKSKIYEKQLEDMKNIIIFHIKNKSGPMGKSITMISFDRLRGDLMKPAMTDESFCEIIDKYPTELCRKKLKNGPGLGLVNSQKSVST